RTVPGIGPRTEAKIRAVLDADRSAPVTVLLLDRARALGAQLAAALGGVPAGPARRWADAVDRLAVVVPTTEPDHVRPRFAALPQIGTLVSEDVRVTLAPLPAHPLPT